MHLKALSSQPRRPSHFATGKQLLPAPIPRLPALATVWLSARQVRRFGLHLKPSRLPPDHQPSRLPSVTTPSGILSLGSIKPSRFKNKVHLRPSLSTNRPLRSPHSRPPLSGSR